MSSLVKLAFLSHETNKAFETVVAVINTTMETTMVRHIVTWIFLWKEKKNKNINFGYN